MKRLAVVAALLGAAACARPHATDVAALVAAHGLDGAADELRFRIASDPHDRDAQAALGVIEARRGRPGAALEALGRAVALGGPPTRGIDPADRARLAALYVDRARERIARGAPAATDDLERARRLGATIPDDVARGATIDAAIAELRHADADTRAHGRARLAPLATDPRFGFAAPSPSIAQLAASGTWLWGEGARRAALETLDAWVARGGLDAPAADPRAAEAWLAARAWWSDDAPAAAIARARAIGASVCAIARTPADGCAPATEPTAWEPILWRRAEARGWRGADPAWLVVGARAWLRGDAASYDDAVRAHVELAPGDAPAWARPTLARLAGRPEADVRAALDAAIADATSAGEPPGPRLVVAIEAARAGRGADELVAILGPDRGAPGDALIARVREPDDTAAPTLARAAAAYAARREPARTADLAAIATAYLHDAALGDRVADDWIARDVDVAARAPLVATLFAALGDPARARALWQRAADASPGELRVTRGLALAAVATDDPDAAMIFVTGAAAASGDAAPVLVEVARALAAHGRFDHALELVKLALQLVPRDATAPLLDLAIAWSRAEGKATAELDAARAAFPPAPPPAAPPRPRTLAELAAIAADPEASDDAAADAWTAFAAARR